MREFPLVDYHSRAHFFLRLLNAADPQSRIFDSHEQLTLKGVWRTLKAICGDYEGVQENALYVLASHSKLSKKRKFEESRSDSGSKSSNEYSRSISNKVVMSLRKEGMSRGN